MKKLELMKGPFSPKEKIEYAEGSIVSQEFIHNRAGNLTLFSFDEGQQLSEHTAPTPLFIICSHVVASVTAMRRDVKISPAARIDFLQL